MPAGLLIKLSPTGPWRIGPDSGDRDRVDRIYHSDALYSAVCWAMSRLGMLEDWLAATALGEQSAVVFSSCFPFQGDTLYVVAPRTVWPPAESSKVRWKGARFVPLSIVRGLLTGTAPAEDQWRVDAVSECLIPSSAPASTGPVRVSVRTHAAMDRYGAGLVPHSTACLEFAAGAGLWCVAAFADEAARDRWTASLTAALRLLADSGFGGERSQGWGRAHQPEIAEGELLDLLGIAKPEGEPAFWMLSLFHPAPSDAVDWTQGNYAITMRGGRVESDAGSGSPKKPTRMVTEGSVLAASSAPNGSAIDVAPEGFPHPVFRSGFALALPIPQRAAAGRSGS